MSWEVFFHECVTFPTFFVNKNLRKNMAVWHIDKWNSKNEVLFKMNYLSLLFFCVSWSNQFNSFELISVYWGLRCIIGWLNQTFTKDLCVCVFCQVSGGVLMELVWRSGGVQTDETSARVLKCLCVLSSQSTCGNPDRVRTAFILAALTARASVSETVFCWRKRMGWALHRLTVNPPSLSDPPWWTWTSPQISTWTWSR